MYVYVCICIYMYVCVCICMYVYVSYVGLGGPTGSREGGSRYVSIMHANGGGRILWKV